MITRNRAALFIVPGLLVLAPLVSVSREADSPELVDGVAAIVNDRHVLVSEVRRGMAPAYARLSRLYDGEELASKLDEQKDAVLRALIARQLILTCYPAPAAEMLDMLVKERETQTVDDRFDGDRSAFLEALTSEHISLDEWRENMADLISHSLIRRNEIGGSLVVSPLAVRQYYEQNMADYKEPAQVKLSVIVVPKAEDEDQLELQREQMASLHRQLEEGAEFPELAKKFSQDPKAESGGNWGWVAPSDLRPELARAANVIETGKVSDVIDAGFALCVLKVEGRREERAEAFQDVRDSIRRKLLAEKQARVYEEWIDRLKKRSYVKVMNLDSE